MRPFWEQRRLEEGYDRVLRDQPDGLSQEDIETIEQLAADSAGDGLCGPTRTNACDFGERVNAVTTNQVAALRDRR